MAQKKKADLDMDEDFPTLFDELKHGFATAFAEIKVVMLQMLERSPFSCYLERSDEAKSNGEFLSQMLWQEVKLVSVWPDDGYCEIEVYNKEGILVGTLDSVKPERMIDGDKLRYGSDEWLTALGCILPFVKAYVRAAVGTPTPNRDRREQFDPNGECDYKIYVEPLPFDISEVLDLSCATLKRVKKNRSLVSSLVVSEVQTVSDEESSVLKPREKVSPDQWIANASINELCDYLAKKSKTRKITPDKGFLLPDPIPGIDLLTQTMLVSKTVCEISRKGITNLRPGMDWPEKKGSAPTEDPTIRASAFYKDKSKTLIRASAIPATKRRGNKKPEWANKSFIECEQKTVKYITRDVLLYVLYHNGYVSADVLNGYEAF